MDGGSAHHKAIIYTKQHKRKEIFRYIASDFITHDPSIRRRKGILCLRVRDILIGLAFTVQANSLKVIDPQIYIVLVHDCELRPMHPHTTARSGDLQAGTATERLEQICRT
jgi:hypothetical protein